MPELGGTVSTAPLLTSFRFSSTDARKVSLALFFSEARRVQGLPMNAFSDDRLDKHPSMVRALVPLVQVMPGHWRCETLLAPGRHEYLFLVDGEWMLDPAADELCSDGDGAHNCVRIVECVVMPERVASNPRFEITRQRNRPASRRVAA